MDDNVVAIGDGKIIQKTFALSFHLNSIIFINQKEKEKKEVKETRKYCEHSTNVEIMKFNFFFCAKR